MYKLSKVVPVPMKSGYTDSVMGPICVSWLQWCGARKEQDDN